MRETFYRTIWDLQRFGFTPSKLIARVGNAAPRIVCTSLPKAGTHLLERAICLHPLLYRAMLPAINDRNVADLGRLDPVRRMLAVNPAVYRRVITRADEGLDTNARGLQRVLATLAPGQLALTHLRYEERYTAVIEQSDARSVFLIRDPRDILVSLVKYVTTRRDHRLHDDFNALPTMRARLLLAIRGDARLNLSGIRERLEESVGWLHDESLVVRFEDLVGARGGGDDEAQLATVMDLFGHLGLETDRDLLRSIASRLFSTRTRTFRRGALGQWRHAFGDEVEEVYNDAAGELTAAYGYSQ